MGMQTILGGGGMQSTEPWGGGVQFVQLLGGGVDCAFRRGEGKKKYKLYRGRGSLYLWATVRYALIPTAPGHIHSGALNGGGGGNVVWWF